MKKIYKIDRDFNGERIEVEASKPEDDIIVIEFINPKKKKEKFSIILKSEDLETIASDK